MINHKAIVLKKKKKKLINNGYPLLNFSEEKILLKINFWVNEYLLELNHQNETNRKLAHLKIPTTKMCSEYFKIGHNDILVLLNNFERYGLIEKRRRQSEGLTGVGFDGALHSEIKITEKGREMCVKIVTI